MLVALVTLCAVGCLSPPPIEEEPVSRHAPEIDLLEVKPSNQSAVFVDLSKDQNLEFTVAGAVTDEDGDTIHYYWTLVDSEGNEWELEKNSRTPAVTLRPCTDTGYPLPALDNPPALLFLQLDVADRARPDVDDTVGDVGETSRFPDDAAIVTLGWVMAIRGACPPRDQ